jgi:hypothetical protein
LVAMLGTSFVDGRRDRIGRLCLFVGSFLAPASSAIGFLAGPLAALALFARRPGRPRALIPLAGTSAFLAIGAFFRYDRILGGGISGPRDRLGGAILALEAPMARLVPGTLAATGLDLFLPGQLILACSLVVLVEVVTKAARERRIDVAAVGLGFILGGYLLSYPFRYDHLPHWLFAVERFHLYPLVGLIFLIAMSARRWLSRFDGSAIASLAAADVAVAVLLLIHAGRHEQQATIYRHPGQQDTLAALVRVGALCEQLGVSRHQCLAALDPVWSYWFQQEFNGLWLVPEFGVGPARTDAEVRTLILGRLSLADRQALWGGMDASPLAMMADEAEGQPLQTVSQGHFASAHHCEPCRGDSSLPTYRMTGWPALLEYRMGPQSGKDSPRYLCLPTGSTKKPVEVSWRGEGEDWSQARSLRFQPDPSISAREWLIPLDRLPHRPRTPIEAIRVRFVAPPIVFGPPRLVR